MEKVLRAAEGIVSMNPKGRTLGVMGSGWLPGANLGKDVGMEIRFQEVQESLGKEETECEPYIRDNVSEKENGG